MPGPCDIPLLCLLCSHPKQEAFIGYVKHYAGDKIYTILLSYLFIFGIV